MKHKTYRYVQALLIVNPYTFVLNHHQDVISGNLPIYILSGLVVVLKCNIGKISDQLFCEVCIPVICQSISEEARGPVIKEFALLN